MKKQTYLSYIEDVNGRMIDFNRWAFKRPETIVKKHKEALEQDRTFWRKIWRDGVTLAIYATPDGYNKEPQPVITISLDELESQAV
jgi:hypothetical protein